MCASALLIVQGASAAEIRYQDVFLKRLTVEDGLAQESAQSAQRC